MRNLTFDRRTIIRHNITQSTIVDVIYVKVEQASLSYPNILHRH